MSGCELAVDVAAYDANAQPVIGQLGELVIRSPMPSMPLRLWNDPDGERYRATYFETSPVSGATATGSCSPSGAAP